MRERPSNAVCNAWAAFNEWADENGIGEHPGDWMPWWNCWCAGINAFQETL